MQPSRQDDSGSEVFGPSPTLKAISLVLGGLSAAAFLLFVATSAVHGNATRILAASILLIPCILPAAILRRRLEVDDAGLTDRSLILKRRISWEDIRRVDIRRGSFSIETRLGPISMGLIAPAERERVLNVVVERAKLTRNLEDLAWGLDGQYLPRQVPIGFAEFKPHNQRTPKQ